MPANKRRVSSDGSDDPLTQALAKLHENESVAERQIRLANEKEAKKISDSIDEELKRTAPEKKAKVVKVLLLGQSESGKSTTLKNFQLINSPKAFRAERASWRAIVQLNVIQSFRLILGVVIAAMDQASQPPRDPSDDPNDPIIEYPELTPEIHRLKIALSPLARVEEALWRKLSPEQTLQYQSHLSPVTNLPEITERSVNSSVSWKNAFGRLMSANERTSLDIDFDDPQDPAVVLSNCAEDMKRLWNDPTTKKLLAAHQLRLEDKPGFFLDAIDRVTAHKYVPTDDDILKARLKTIGVTEHKFSLRAGNMLAHDWRIFDVGGARTNRAAWVPYFDDMNAIIFLAPLSCFDQMLDEDKNINRLEDSINLWKEVVSNPLLKDTELILFLNKCDILKAKLEAGLEFRKWVLSYGQRPNTLEGTSNYMKKKFATIHKQMSPKPRVFYCHFTCVVDVKATYQILTTVKDMLVRKNLEHSSMV
ncbi:guanine nucleotide binding protein, alpha subunit [Mycena floridula]|nr:guanine nucleotide binding protein, alpha subunit [Mycena floridula]